MTILKHKTDGSKPVAQNWNGYRSQKQHEEQELLFQLESVFWQACGETENRIDTLGLSAYEEAARYLAKKGRITGYNGRTGVMKK